MTNDALANSCIYLFIISFYLACIIFQLTVDLLLLLVILCIQRDIFKEASKYKWQNHHIFPWFNAD